MYWQYSIEMFKNGEWILENRYYKTQKPLPDIDLHDVEGKRRNAKFIKRVSEKDLKIIIENYNSI